MGVLGEKGGWCFCSGGGKSERVKGSIFSGKAPAMASISGGGTGFLIHRSLLLTTHANVSSVAAAEAAEVRIHRGQVLAHLAPHRFFITSSVLDLTIVGLDTADSDSTSQGNQPQYLKTCSNPNLDLGSVVYLLGHTDKKELTVGEGKVVIATDNLIKLSTDGITWCPGSAGFDIQGNLAFMVCDPMKLATSPAAKSSSASASSSSSLTWKKDSSTQFGIPIPVIRDWLNQQWEGSLDELSKPKLQLIRLMSSGQKSEHSCASFTQRRVFKPAEGENDDFSSASQIASKPRVQHESAKVIANTTHEQGIPTPDIFESPKLTSGPLWKADVTPKVPRSIVLPLPLKQLLMNSDENRLKEPESRNQVRKEPKHKFNHVKDGDCHSEVMSSSSPMEACATRNDLDGFSSGEETMYSAETMESRNIPSPKENRFQQVGRSQSCVNYSRWSSSTQRSSAAGQAALQKQQSMISVRKTHSHATTPVTQRSHDYFSPTVSSSMKKRNSVDLKLQKPRQSIVQMSPRER